MFGSNIVQCISHIFAVLSWISPIDAGRGLCKGRNIEEPCWRDEDCYALNSICGPDRLCQCAHGYQHVDAFNNLTIPMKCKPAPSKYGADCIGRCKPPLICDKDIGECICPEDSDYDEKKGTCVFDPKAPGKCESNEDCVQPFTECVLKRCVCQRNTRHIQNKCVPMCPDQTLPRGNCRRLFETRDKLLAVLDKADTCAKGYHCLAFGHPPVGLCCPLRCPYGRPLLAKSCEPSANQATRCPSTSHFCSKFEVGDGSTSRLCCPRPCREPYPLYIGGHCLERSWLDDPCITDAQCDYNESMTCVQHVCQCKNGYSPNSKAKFPSCIKDCVSGTFPVRDRCVVPGGTQSRCTSDRDCRGVFICINSRCSCPCGYQPVGQDNCLREAWAKSIPKSLEDVPNLIQIIGK